MESILTSIKKLLGIDEEYDAFDPDIIIHINSTFATLNQLGIGPENGFRIEGEDATWFDYTENNLLIENVKTYIYLKVRLVFDPPTSGSLIEAIKTEIKELEWRLNVTAESQKSD